MKPPAPAAWAPSSRRWCTNTASITWRRRSSAWPAGTRRIRTRWSGPTFPGRHVSPRRCGASRRRDERARPPEARSPPRGDGALRHGGPMTVRVIKVPDIGEGIAEVELVAVACQTRRSGGRGSGAGRSDDRQGGGRGAVTGGRQRRLAGRRGRPDARRRRRVDPPRGGRRPRALATPWPRPSRLLSPLRWPPRPCRHRCHRRR